MRDRKRKIISHVILASAAFFFSQGLTYSQSVENKISNAPRIKIPEKIKDFGAVKQGDVLEQEFEIQNVGSKDLIIRSLNPSCGCTSAVINEPTVKPGEKSFIRFTFKTADFRGPKEKTLRVYSNDPLDSSEVITVKANILEAINLNPEVLELGEIVRERGFEKTVLIKSPSAITFKIVEVITKSEFIGSKLEATSEGAYNLKIFSQDKLPLGSLRSRIIIKTDNKSSPLLVIPISFYVVGDLVASPKSINFGFIKKSTSNEESLTRIVRINKASESQNTKVVSVEKSNREVDASLDEDAAGQYVSLHINSLAKGVIRGLLRIITDSENEDDQVIEVPYFAVVNTDAN